MTVSTTINKISYVGNGISSIFAIPFPFLQQEHLKIYQLLNDVQSERKDWAISEGNVVFETAPVENAQIVIMREVPLTQETDYRENEILAAETLERNFDKLTMQVQQLKEQAERAVTVDIFDNTDAASLIPSIRQSVSDAAAYAATATQKAQIASDSADKAAALLENKVDKNVYASKTVRGLAKWAAAKNEINENTPPAIISVVQSENTTIRLWSDGFKEVFDFFINNDSAVISYTFPVVFSAKPFVMLSQTLSTGGSISSVIEVTTTGMQFANKSVNTFYTFAGWIYLGGY